MLGTKLFRGISQISQIRHSSFTVVQQAAFSTSAIRCALFPVVLLRQLFYASHTNLSMNDVPFYFRKNENIFNVQDEEDFEKRVKQSKTPVIVDFHAT